jgi:quercetin dioxygenase-like cupin family protein
MKKVSRKHVKGTSPEGTKGVDFRPLIAKEFAAPHFYMRFFDIAPGGHTPKHSHEWEHEVYIITGSGRIALQDRDVSIKEGDAVLIEPDELHQFVNTGDSSLQMICVIPRQ